MKKKVLFFLLTVFIITLNVLTVNGKSIIYSIVLKDTDKKIKTISNHQKSINLEKNDFILLGKYLNEPILWQVLDVDKNGHPLLLSYYIISFKSFDAAGEDKKYHNGEDYEAFGSSEWKDSSLNQWLNSTEDKVNYSHCIPTDKATFNGKNAYTDESGFLNDNNFNYKTLEMIYGKNERVFLLSQKENSKYLNEKERQKTCTKSAILQNDSSFLVLPSQKVCYWICSKIKANRSSVVTVMPSGRFYKSLAYDSTTGVCPAIRLKQASIVTNSGDGSFKSPYRISS